MQIPNKPFLKWPGGKRWAANTICNLISTHLAADGKYIEPFLGGGAVFFHLQPGEAILSDINKELIEVYRTVRSCHRTVTMKLRALRTDRKQFNRIRKSLPKDRIDRAVRFLYLNRTSFGGMYRVN